MSNTTSLSGQCICGSVRVLAESAATAVGACHCKTCRRWSGGPFMEVNCGQAVTFEGEENVTVFNSSDWAERGFCRNCGTHLFYRLKGTGEHFVPVGLFDDRADFNFDHEVFVDERPAFYEFANRTHEMTGAEVFAMFKATN